MQKSREEEKRPKPTLENQMAQKPSIPKGTRDFSPLEMARRNYIFDKIREAFRLHGFHQIETPAMENLSTLMGKYGEEGDRLLFKILNSGDYLKGIDKSEINEDNLTKLASKLCEKGLRYDLTVPFARYVVQHRQDIQMPFKRFQMQPVWRADRPQKGRYREFYQCDADIVGSDSLHNEVELLGLIDSVMSSLGIRVSIMLNNRKVLTGISEVIGEPEKLIDMTVAIDKIDKIGVEAVKEELRERGFKEEAISRLQPILELHGTNQEKIARLSEILDGSDIGKKGIEELREVIDSFEALGHVGELMLNVSLARGLNYYTGTIIEVKALDTQIGSITGGGRYDNLTGYFGGSGLSGVGISFGADRIYDVMTTLNLYPVELTSSVKVLFVNFGKRESLKAESLARKLRAGGISCMVYPDASKMKKQMGYADSEAIPYVVIIGEEELENGCVTVKNMGTGEQTRVSDDELIACIK